METVAEDAEVVGALGVEDEVLVALDADTEIVHRAHGLGQGLLGGAEDGLVVEPQELVVELGEDPHAEAPDADHSEDHQKDQARSPFECFVHCALLMPR